MFRPLAMYFVLAVVALGQTQPAFEDLRKIDIHAHYFDDMPEFAKMLERIDMRVVNICVFKNRPELIQTLHERAAGLAKQYAQNMRFASTFDLSKIDDPDFAGGVNAWLDKWIDAGAVMTKIWKEVGMQKRTADGAFVMPDSELLDPIYAHLEKRGKPLMAHFADPIEAWQPLEPGSTHYKYFSENPEWHMYGKKGVPSHEDIMAAYERMLGKHPGLVVIGAHLGSLEHDLDALARRFDRFPNYHVDVSARTPDLRHYPAETIRAFFTKYQDRILYGLDAGKYHAEGISPEEQHAVTEQIEAAYRRDFSYYAGEELALPREVLEKFYHGNAGRILASLK